MRPVWHRAAIACVALASVTLCALVGGASARPATLGFKPEQDQDPFHGADRLGRSDEILLLRMETATNAETIFSQEIWDYLNLRNPAVDNELRRTSRRTETAEWAVAGSEMHDAVVGDLNGDTYDDAIVAWEGAGGSVNLGLPRVARGTLEWSNAFRAKAVPEGGLSAAASGTPFRLALGDFDGDTQDEFVLAYLGSDETLQLHVYDTAGSLEPMRAAVSNDFTLRPDRMGRAPSFAVCAGDFNGDNIDELLVAVSQLDANDDQRVLETAIYGYDPQAPGGAALVALLRDTPDVGRNDAIAELDVVAGFFDDDPVSGDPLEQDLVVVLSEDTQEGVLGRLVPMRVLPDFAGIEVPRQGPWAEYARNAVSGDLNGDGRDEVITTGSRGWKIWRFGDDLQLFVGSHRIGASPTQLTGHRRLVLADLDGDDLREGEEWAPEIVTMEHWCREGTGLRVFDVTYNPNSEVPYNVRSLVDWMEIDWGANGIPCGFSLGLLAGDFDANGVRVGRPKRYSKTAIARPMVILNAPPVHFDMFDGTSYDVSNCYNGNACNFRAGYEKFSEQALEVETEVHADWGGSQTLKTSAGVAGFGVSSKLTSWYGEGFSRTNQTRQSARVTVRAEAIEDDLIYATVVDYDIWEYPVYQNGALQGHVMAVKPIMTGNKWFSSKSWSAGSYVPRHEVGNILSYADFDNLRENADVAALIKGSTDNAFGLNANSSFDWLLEFEDFSSNSVSERHRSGSEWSASASLGGAFKMFTGGIQFSGSGFYESEEISTQTTTVRSGLSVEMHLDGIDRSIGETNYEVIPYAYWAKNGALVLDYAVRGERSEPGFTPTWWQQRYEEAPDPAFILPWRLDPEKGFAIEDPAKRHQTKEIRFSTSTAGVGEQVTIGVRIHNFSLIPTDGPVKVRFYVGDPDAGGTAIVGANGETDVSTEGVIGSRDHAFAQMDWIVPTGIGRLPRIYAVLDPDGENDEIHEENNKGWTVLPTSDDTSTPVLFQDLHAYFDEGAVHVQWNVAADASFVGVRLVRADASDRRRVVAGERQLLSIGPGRHADRDVRPGESYSYWLIAVQSDGSEVASRIVAVSAAPPAVAMYPNVPNPFNPRTKIAFSLGSRENARLVVYDPRGRVVKTLVDTALPPGRHEVVWDGTNDRGTRQSSGVYLYRLVTPSVHLTRKMTLLQ